VERGAGSWNWSDGTPVGSGDHFDGDDDADGGFRIQESGSATMGSTFDFVFAADPGGWARAATLLISIDGDKSSTVTAFLGNDTANAVTLLTHSQGSNENGLFTVEYDGTEALTIRITDTGDDANTETIFRGVAATLSGVPEPSATVLVALGGMLLVGRRRRG